jgi:hypothetical protein
VGQVDYVGLNASGVGQLDREAESIDRAPDHTDVDVGGRTGSAAGLRSEQQRQVDLGVPGQDRDQAGAELVNVHGGHRVNDAPAEMPGCENP